MRPTPQDWRALQRAVAEVLAADGYAAEVEKSIKTVRSVVNFDVYAEKFVGGIKLAVVAECKHWRNNVPQAVVHAFRAQVEDLGADVGYIVSSAGFQSGAHETARNTNIRLVTWNELLDLFEPEGTPLGTGLKGSAQIVHGKIIYLDQKGTVLPWMSSLVTGGTIRREPNAGILVTIETEAALPGLQEANAAVGWKGFELRTLSDQISGDPAAPTVLTGTIEFTTAPGMEGLNPVTGAKVVIPVAVRARLDVRAEGFLQGDLLKGTWVVAAHTSLAPQTVPLQGSFSIRVF